MEKKDLKKSQGGFTLIEIIAVLVILGILAAVAIPRFADLRTEAEQASAESGLAAGISNLNLAFARLVLDGGTTCAAVQTEAKSTLVVTKDDLDVTYGDCSEGGVITVTSTYGGATVSADWTFPN